MHIEDMIKTNQEILKILYYDDNSINPLGQPDLTRSQAKEVCRKYIFKGKKIPADNDTTLKTYICMRYGQKVYHHRQNQYFNGNTYKLYVISHDDHDNNAYIGSRVCEIERCIEDMFDDGEISVVFKTNVGNSVDFDIKGVTYSGREIIIEFSDFNGDKNGY